MSTSVSTWMVDHQGRLGAVNLGPFVSVDLNLRPTIYIADIVLGRKMNQIKKPKTKRFWRLVCI